MKNKDKIIYRRSVNAWCIYDWANSGYSTTVVAAMLPPYFSSVAHASGFTKTQASSIWGYTTSLAMLSVALLAPILGALADYTGTKKKYMFVFFLVGVIFTSLLVLIDLGEWLLCLIFFAISGIGFTGTNVFYDSLLPHVAKHDEIDQVSAKGYALGYLGGGLLLAVNLLMFTKHYWFGIPTESWGVRLSFLSVSIWWAIFSIPVFWYVKEPPCSRDYVTLENPLKASFRNLITTFRKIRMYKYVFMFLIAYWLYADGIGTIIRMASIYGTEIGIGMSHLVGALLLTQFIGTPSTLLFGQLAKKIGTKNTIISALSIYVLISICGYFITKPIHFWILAITVGLVQGGSQALSRSLFASMIPKAKSAEFFGFFEVSSKFAGIAGPLIFGIVGQFTGTTRLSIISLIIFFISGIVMLLFLNEKEGIKIAQEENIKLLLTLE